MAPPMIAQGGSAVVVEGAAVAVFEAEELTMVEVMTRVLVGRAPLTMVVLLMLK